METTRNSKWKFTHNSKNIMVTHGDKKLGNRRKIKTAKQRKELYYRSKTYMTKDINRNKIEGSCKEAHSRIKQNLRQKNSPIKSI